MTFSPSLNFRLNGKLCKEVCLKGIYTAVYFLLSIFIRGLYKRIDCLSFIRIGLMFGQLRAPVMENEAI